MANPSRHLQCKFAIQPHRLSGLFNFSGIPFGVLIGKDGKEIKIDYHFYTDEHLLIKALEE